MKSIIQYITEAEQSKRMLNPIPWYEFIKLYKDKTNSDANVFAALGYDTGSIIEAALKTVKDMAPESIRDAVKAVSLDLVTGKLVFDEERNPQKAVTFVEVKGGKVVLKEKVE